MNFKFELTEEEANLVLVALMDQPYKYVAGVVEKMNMQAYKQREAAKPVAKPEKDFSEY